MFTAKISSSFFQLPNGKITQKMPKEYLDIQLIGESENDAGIAKT